MMKNLRIIAFMMAIGMVSCQQKETNEEKVVKEDETVARDDREIEVYSFHDKAQLKKYTDLNLDESHPNLLNPEISKEDMNEVVESWTDLHQNIGKYLAEQNFDWGIEDSTVSIVHKIYFNPEGEIKSYFFNVLNKDVAAAKKEEFSTMIRAFAKNNKIKIQKDHPFAQCGKTRYMN